MKMNNPLLTIANLKEYTNIDAIPNAINYIYREERNINPTPFCYGIYPPTYENIIVEFENVRSMNTNPLDQRVRHLVLSFKDTDVDMDCFRLADNIAKLFSNKYFVCYALHKDTNHAHFHFIISTSSYYQNGCNLEEHILYQYIEQALIMAQNNNINLEFKGA